MAMNFHNGIGTLQMVAQAARLCSASGRRRARRAT
jgi:hypothetical protein